MKNEIFRNWNFMRLLRMIIGIAILVQAIMAKDVLFGMAGILFSSMAVFNLGCCGTGTCYTSPIKNAAPPKEVIYEEVV